MLELTTEGREFTVLAGNTALLFLQLSAFDLLYGLFGFPHFIQALLGDLKNPFEITSWRKVVLDSRFTKKFFCSS